MGKEKAMEFDSDEEMYFSAYLEELKELGVALFVKHHPKPLVLSNRVTAVKKSVNRRKELYEKEVFLMHPHSYEYDFLVELNPKYEGRYFCTLDSYDKNIPVVANLRNNGKIYWLVEVKPSFEADRGSNTRFPLNQKWVYSRYNLYVQKVIPEEGKAEGFFSKTFFPKAYLFRPLKNGKGFKKVRAKNKITTSNEYAELLEKMEAIPGSLL